MQGAAAINPHRLKRIRVAAKESKAELATALGLGTTVSIDRWENGKDIPIYHARKIAERYSVSVGFLLGDGEEAAA